LLYITRRMAAPNISVEEIDMKVIAVASQKGGSGRRPRRSHRGAGRARRRRTSRPRRHRPARQLAAWWNVRQADTPVFARLPISRISPRRSAHARPRHASSRHRHPAGDRRHNRRGHTASPISSSFRRGRARTTCVRPRHRRARRAAGQAAGLRHQRRAHRARITSEAVIALSQHGTLAPSIIPSAPVFAAHDRPAAR